MTSSKQATAPSTVRYRYYGLRFHGLTLDNQFTPLRMKTAMVVEPWFGVIPFISIHLYGV
jgi:hypothetical protein